VATQSAGLRVRLHASLQSEQIGVIPPAGVISFTSEVPAVCPSVCSASLSSATSTLQTYTFMLVNISTFDIEICVSVTLQRM